MINQDTQDTGKKIRVLVTMPGLDGHDWGALVVSQALRDAGIEVIYLGIRQMPETIVDAAIAEDADAIALSLKDSSHMIYFPKVVELLKEKNASDICVFGGGIIPDEDKPLLEKIGVTGNFSSGTSLKVIVDHIVKRVEKTRAKKE